MWVTKGTKVRYRFFRANPIGTWSLAGAQDKVTATEVTGEGIIRGVWSDKPAGQGGKVQFEVESSNGDIVEVPATGVYWAEDGNGKGYHVQF